MAWRANLQRKAREIKEQVLTSSYEAHACHITSALSCVDILVDVFYRLKSEKDIFLFGKASGVGAFYAVLADLGHFARSEIAEYLKKYPLPSREVPGVLFSFGSLGHALPVAVGMALADRDRKVYVLLSDGECQEGTTYEAALFARHHNLTNLYVIVDDNQIQALGYTHDILDLSTAWEFLGKTIPHFTRVTTLKGAGVSFMEGDPAWHYKNLTPALLEQALTEIRNG